MTADGGILGHDAVRERLRRSAASGRVPHAMLFSGPEGIGKRAVALELARHLVTLDDAEEGARFDRRAHDRFVLYEDLDRPLCVPRVDMLAVAGGAEELLAEYALLEAEGWITGVSAARGDAAVDRLVRNPEKFIGRKGIPFADVLEKELNALEKSRRSTSATVDVARRLFSGGTSRAYYRRNLGIELINGKGDGSYFRTVESLLSRSAAGWRVAVLDDAHHMTEAAENAFLKTLEEPPPNTLLILITSEALSLLPTTLSRCARVVFDSLPSELVARFLVERQGIPAADAELVASLSGGSIGKALELGELDFTERRRFAEKLLTAIAEGDLARCLALLGVHLAEAEGDNLRDAQRRQARFLLELLALAFRDVALATAVPDIPSLAGLDPSVVRELAAARGVETWERLFEASITASADVDRSVEPRLALEAMLTDAVPAPIGAAP
jgi:DNA polymerase III delta prime subunit